MICAASGSQKNRRHSVYMKHLQTFEESPRHVCADTALQREDQQASEMISAQAVACIQVRLLPKLYLYTFSIYTYKNTESVTLEARFCVVRKKAHILVISVFLLDILDTER